MKYNFKYNVYFLLFFLIGTLEAQWTHLPGPYGGEIGQLTTYDSKIYAVTQSAIYYSTDNCNNWAELTRKGTGPIIFNKNRIIGYLWDRSDPNLTGIKYSVDKGVTWKRASKGVEGSVNAFVELNNEIFAATNYRLYKSTDNGDNWESINGSPSWIKKLIVKDNLIFAGSWGNGIYISYDEGKTWQQSNNGLQNLYITSFLIKESTIYTGTSFNLFESNDNGISWKRVFNDPDDLIKGRLNIESILLFQNKLFVGISGEFLRHFDYSAGMWEIHNTSGLNLCPTQDFQCMESIDKNLLIGTFYGILKSSDYGYSWEWSNIGISECTIGKLLISEGNMFASNVPNFLSTSADLGNTWQKIYVDKAITNSDEFPKELIMNASAPNFMLKDNYIFLSTDYISLRSTDRGNTWGKLILGGSNSFCRHKDKVFALGDGINYSTDYGISWILIPTQYNGSEAIKGLCSAGDYLYGATNSNGLFRSRDEGYTWEYVSNAFEDPYYTPSIPIINSISYNGKYLFVATNNGFFKSSDFGTTWYRMKLIKNTGSVDRYVRLYSKDKYVFVDRFYSFDYGETWQSIFNGTAQTPVYGELPSNVTCYLIIENYLYAGTERSGIWKTPLSMLNDVIPENETLPLHYSLSQNYPNPFNPETTIKYQIPQSGHVTLKIYDVLGREVATLVNEHKNTGEYQVKFNGNNLASGIYFYHLHTGSFMQSKKMILIR